MTKKTNKKNELIIIVDGKKEVLKNVRDLTPMLNKKFGKPGTKKRQKNIEKAMKIFRADNLSFERKEAKKTQKEVAEKIGVDETYISKIENGAVTPSVDLFYKYVEAIGKRVEIV